MMARSESVEEWRPGSLTIDEAGKDVSEIVRVLARYRSEESTPRADMSTSAFADMIVQSTFARIAIARYKSEPIGFALYTFSATAFYCRRSIQISDLWVNPGFRGKGVGSALLRAVEFIAATQGCASMYLFVDPHNSAARTFYVTQGWQEQTLVYYRKLVGGAAP